MLPTEVTTAELARLLGVSRRNFPGLAERKIIMPGSRKGTYALEPSISGYAKHLRRLAQGRHGTGETLSPRRRSRRYGAESSALSAIAFPTGSHTSARQTVSLRKSFVTASPSLPIMRRVLLHEYGPRAKFGG